MAVIDWDELNTVDMSDRTPALVWRNSMRRYEPAQLVAVMAEHLGMHVRAVFERGIVAEGLLVSLTHPDGYGYVLADGPEGLTHRGVILAVEPLDDATRAASGVSTPS